MYLMAFCFALSPASNDKDGPLGRSCLSSSLRSFVNRCELSNSQPVCAFSCAVQIMINQVTDRHKQYDLPVAAGCQFPLPFRFARLPVLAKSHLFVAVRVAVVILHSTSNVTPCQRHPSLQCATYILTELRHFLFSRLRRRHSGLRLC